MKKFFWLHRSNRKEPNSPIRLKEYESLSEQTGRPLIEILAETGFYPKDGRKFDMAWWYFSRLAACRQYGMGGASAITHQEIEAWARLESVDITRTGLAVLREIDILFLEGMSEDA